MAVAITQTANPSGVSSSSNVATYSGVAIGDAAANRIVVVLVGSELASASINSVTLGGNSMNAGTEGNFGAVYARAFYLAYPTGTTADIVVTYGANASSTQNHIAVYSVTGGVYSSTGADGSSDMDATDRLTTGSITIASGGGFIAVAGGATDGTAKTWANATEDLDNDVGNFRFTTATRTTALTTTAVTCTGGTNGEDGALSYVIFTDNTEPTVALNTPADAATGVSTTPTLEFTGTDTNSDSVRYNVQIGTATPLTSTITVGTSGSQITDSTPSITTVSTLSTTSKFIAFAGNHQGTITAVTLNGTSLTKMVTSATAFNETAEIWYLDNPGALTNVTLTGTFSGGSGRFLGYVCLEGTKSGVEDVEATATGSDASPTVNITPTADDSIVLSCAYAEDNFTQGAGETNIFILESDTYECGAASYDIQGTIETQAMNYNIGSGQRWAICAVAIAPVSNVTINKVSGTDAGFANTVTPADTDPFNSGEKADYDVQAGDTLTASTTYYWRVRAIDPSGSNAYGAWATTRSFEVVPGGGRRRIILTS